MATKQEIYATNIQELQKEGTRLAVRRTLFETIGKNDDLHIAYKDYEKNAESIVPTSVDKWAQRRGEDVPKARETELRRIFEKDVVRFERGLIKNKRTNQITVTDNLKKGLREDHIRQAEIRVALKKLGASA